MYQPSATEGHAGSFSCSHILQIDLPEVSEAEALSVHIDRFLQIYLRDFAPLAGAFERVGPLAFCLDAEGFSDEALESLRADIAQRLFADFDSARVRLEPDPSGSVEDYEPALASSPSRRELDYPDADVIDLSGEFDLGATIWDESQPDEGRTDLPAEADDLAAELAGFRHDMRAIAEGLTAQETLSTTIEAFRREISELSEGLGGRVERAADTIETAAERVEAVAALIPDPDRLELVLTRNEASAAILERGVHQALQLLLEAVRTLSDRGEIADPGALEALSGAVESAQGEAEDASSAADALNEWSIEAPDASRDSDAA